MFACLSHWMTEWLVCPFNYLIAVKCNDTWIIVWSKHFGYYDSNNKLFLLKTQNKFSFTLRWKKTEKHRTRVIGSIVILILCKQKQTYKNKHWFFIEKKIKYSIIIENHDEKKILEKRTLFFSYKKNKMFTHFFLSNNTLNKSFFIIVILK